MHPLNRRSNALWTILSDALDIPKSLYEKAADRHVLIGEWLCREESSLIAFQPNVRPQGSFRYGTVVKPINEHAEYDLDNVVVLERLHSSAMSQAELKVRFGEEIAAYARKHRMQSPTEHKRCWRLHYRDEVKFHLDSLPCVPAGQVEVGKLRRAGVLEPWAARAIAITDTRHPRYEEISSDWYTSNPRGFARWFESRAATGRDVGLLAQIRAGLIEEVPAYEWKTPLQRCIQILKRHRDVQFQMTPGLAPISMIITNLAAHAYNGEIDLTEALRAIVRGMPSFVRASAPFVPNPTHPAEDYADKWSKDPQLAQNFFAWHEQVSADVERLAAPLARIEVADIEHRFRIRLTENQQELLWIGSPKVVATSTPRKVAIAPAPWAALPDTQT